MKRKRINLRPLLFKIEIQIISGLYIDLERVSISKVAPKGLYHFFLNKSKPRTGSP
jgi:hypothetical protein